MIDRKRLEELRRLIGLKIGMENFPVIELLDTIDALWTVAEAAKAVERRWNTAGLGNGDEAIINALCKALAALEDKRND